MCNMILLLVAAVVVGHITIIADAFFLISTSCYAGRPAFSSFLPATTEAAQSSDDIETTIPAITERMLDLTQNPNIALVIDVENLRGKTSFELDHADFLDRLLVWTKLRNHACGRTIAVIDHGSRSSAHLLHGHDAVGGDVDRDAALCVAFAGPYVKADDIIARDVDWLLSSSNSTTQHVVVITADQELM